MLEKYYRVKEVQAITGLSHSAIYAKMDDDEFPKPVKLGKRAVAWRESDLREWQVNLETT